MSTPCPCRSKGTIPAHRRSRSTPLALDLPSDFTPNSKGPASPIPEDYEKTVAEVGHAHRLQQDC